MGTLYHVADCGAHTRVAKERGSLASEPQISWATRIKSLRRKVARIDADKRAQAKAADPQP